MIIVKLIGGLGNQLFQYALGRNLAIKNNCQLKLDISAFQEYKLHKYSLNHFNIEETFATEDDKNEVMKKRHFYRLTSKIRNKKEPEFKNYYHEKQFHFDPEILNIQGNAYLDGYWQSEKYFKNISGLIKSEFTVKYLLEGEQYNIAQMILGTNSIGLHIRRGDYVNDPSANRILGTCSMDYYSRSIKYIQKVVCKPKFFVFSDDHKWVCENFIINNETIFVTHNNADKNYDDLRLMSLCKHNIIANSSFSWWAAYLNMNIKKNVLAPKKWFNEGLYSTDDLLPLEWIKL